MRLQVGSRGGYAGYGWDKRKKEHSLRDKIIVAVISAILTLGGVGLYLAWNNLTITSNNSVVTLMGQGATTTVTETVTATDTAEINQLNQEIANLHSQVNQLNQQVSELTPVWVYGTINLTGAWGNSLSTISLFSQGITYSVTILNGQFQIYVPRGYVYQVTIKGGGWFWSTWNQGPTSGSSSQLDLTGYGLQSFHVSYGISR